MTVCHMALFAFFGGLSLVVLSGMVAGAVRNYLPKINFSRKVLPVLLPTFGVAPACLLLVALMTGGVKPIHCGKEDSVSRALKTKPVVLAGIPCNCTK